MQYQYRFFRKRSCSFNVPIFSRVCISFTFLKSSLFLLLFSYLFLHLFYPILHSSFIHFPCQFLQPFICLASSRASGQPPSSCPSQSQEVIIHHECFLLIVHSQGNRTAEFPGLPWYCTWNGLYICHAEARQYWADVTILLG